MRHAAMMRACATCWFPPHTSTTPLIDDMCGCGVCPTWSPSWPCPLLTDHHLPPPPRCCPLLQLWRLPNLVPHLTLRGHRRGVWSVEFSPVDQALLTSSGGWLPGWDQALLTSSGGWLAGWDQALLTSSGGWLAGWLAGSHLQLAGWLAGWLGPGPAHGLVACWLGGWDLSGVVIQGALPPVGQ